ncbi:UNVERIFIED_CONTAM: hypothetical protein K2H54_047536 [Gekko kuhli]
MVGQHNQLQAGYQPIQHCKINIGWDCCGGSAHPKRRGALLTTSSNPEDSSPASEAQGSHSRVAHIISSSEAFQAAVVPDDIGKGMEETMSLTVYGPIIISSAPESEERSYLDTSIGNRPPCHLGLGLVMSMETFSLLCLWKHTGGITTGVLTKSVTLVVDGLEVHTVFPVLSRHASVTSDVVAQLMACLGFSKFICLAWITSTMGTRVLETSASVVMNPCIISQNSPVHPELFSLYVSQFPLVAHSDINNRDCKV